MSCLSGISLTFDYKPCNMLSKFPENTQLNVFLTPLVSFINLDHPLCKLAREIRWEIIEKELSPSYSHTGRPAHPIRRMAGLLILKHMKDLSDESLVVAWVENPYFQYFCGEVNFQSRSPWDPTEMVRFRQRIGDKGCEVILSESIRIHHLEKEEKEVLVDTTVQEKNITYPTDTKLQVKIIVKCQEMAERNAIPIRQSYRRTLKKLRFQLRFRRSKRQRELARKASRKIKVIANRLTKELKRKIECQPTSPVRDLNLEKLKLFLRVLAQKPGDSHKVYSLHEPDVECISKGKEHKKYEFGNKSSFVRSRQTGLVLGAMAFHGNPYDGHTLEAQLRQVERLTGKLPVTAIVDQGYRGTRLSLDTEIVHPNQRRKLASPYQERKRRAQLRARASIEPVIGHLKTDHRLIRNFLKGTSGDKINTILAGAAFNFRKWINKVLSRLLNFLFQLLFLVLGKESGSPKDTIQLNQPLYLSTCWLIDFVIFWKKPVLQA